MSLHHPTEVGSPEDAEDRTWRRTRTMVMVLTFWGVVLVLIAINDDPGALAVTITLPVALGALGLVLRLVRPRSPLGHGLLRGAGLVLGVYTAGLVLLLLTLAG